MLGVAASTPRASHKPRQAECAPSSTPAPSKLLPKPLTCLLPDACCLAGSHSPVSEDMDEVSKGVVRAISPQGLQMAVEPEVVLSASQAQPAPEIAAVA